MNIIVSKFGGSSLADAEHFKQVKAIIDLNLSRRYIIVSAPGKRDVGDYKVTDKLIECIQKRQAGENWRECFSVVRRRFIEISHKLDVQIDICYELNTIENKIESNADVQYIVSRGEYLCALLLSRYLGWDMVDATDCILFDNSGRLDINSTDQRIRHSLTAIDRAVIPGFYGSDLQGKIVTFPRNGSDISGALVARGIGADAYENWTDVDGFMMADPQIVQDPKMIQSLTYQELRELAYMGASIPHEDSIYPVSSAGIPTCIKNTNNPSDSGTTISETIIEESDGFSITGIAGRKGFDIIHIEKMLMNDEIGYARKLLQVLEELKIPMEHMSCGIDSISVLVQEKYVSGFEEQTEEHIINTLRPDHYSIHTDMALIAVVGRKMKRDGGFTKRRIFSALEKRKINSWLIDQGANSVNLFIGIDNSDYEDAINAIYHEFA